MLEVQKRHSSSEMNAHEWHNSLYDCHLEPNSNSQVVSSLEACETARETGQTDGETWHDRVKAAQTKVV